MKRKIKICSAILSVGMVASSFQMVNAAPNNTALQNQNAVYTSVESLSTAPANFRISQRSGLGCAFSWRWSGNTEDLYAIYRKPTGSTSEPVRVTEPTKENINVGAETLMGSYDFCVAIVDKDGNRISNYSEVSTVESYYDAPVHFNISQRSGLGCAFSWKWSGNTEDLYAIYRKPTGSTSEPVRVTEPTKDNTNVGAETLMGSYNFYVARVDANGNRISYYSEVSTVESYYDAPVHFNISQRSGLGCAFSWKWSGNTEDMYAIYRKPTGSTSEPVRVTEPTKENINVGAETLMGSYDFCVAIVDKDGNRISYYSNSATVESY
ncbi:fibronectin type III domain-containing protein [Anaeromicropila herbilytica]|uniref:Uncharacterized protein n=1 Tax=Anaeromicropila herbilytica TaxID=2785025 RepID=A0A7R7ENR3_9FIRM|nr:hypothetical protein [Anaeromicropila herbilytica]BCN31940.1 hypothetical protein bsdtb5_32350 [Anaeromicropila herbilytica]